MAGSRHRRSSGSPPEEAGTTTPVSGELVDDAERLVGGHLAGAVGVGTGGGLCSAGSGRCTGGWSPTRRRAER
jgi:hypothetical protein